MKNIDFVLTWVDGSDLEWLQEKNKFESNENDMYHKDGNSSRYRDWDNLKYWFRGVEKCAPWVNKIFFVTWGHLPEWLDINNPKLVIVKHEDFIPREYLPTFSINCIENNFHRIKELSNNFVYFNDDLFLIKEVDEKDFFINEKPVDSAILTVHCYSPKETLVLTPFVDIGVINKYFSLKKVLHDNWQKWFCPFYGKGFLQNIILSKCPRFPGIYQHHLPTALQKSTYMKLWELEEELLNNTCRNRFRSITDVNQWLFREWQLASGDFVPRKGNIGKSFNVMNGIEDIILYIRNRKGKAICINDAELPEDKFDDYKYRINNELQILFPDKSAFEK